MFNPDTTPAIGTVAKAEMTVQACDTSLLPDVADDVTQPVLATSRMVALMETAAARVLQPQLAHDQLSIGVGEHTRSIVLRKRLLAGALRRAR